MFKSEQPQNRRISKGGLARAAQALAPRVAQSLFLINRQNTFLSLGKCRQQRFCNFAIESGQRTDLLEISCPDIFYGPKLVQ